MWERFLLGPMVALAALASGETDEPPGEPAAAPAFRCEDQFGASHEYAFPRDRPLVLIVADKSGTKYVDQWVKPLYEAYKDTVEIRGIAELSAVPSWARGAVRKFIALQTKAPVLLDWTGEIGKAYRYAAGTAHVFVIDGTGKIRREVTEKPTEEELAGVREVLDELVER